MTRLSRFYLGYGCVVGGALFLLMLIGTQAAHSGLEALLAIVLGLIAPIPMLLVGLSLRRGWKAAPVLCIVLPVALAVAIAPVWGRPQPPRAVGALTSAVFNAEYSQLYFLPGAIIGLILLGYAALSGNRHGRQRET